MTSPLIIEEKREVEDDIFAPGTLVMTWSGQRKRDTQGPAVVRTLSPLAGVWLRRSNSCSHRSLIIKNMSVLSGTI